MKPTSVAVRLAHVAGVARPCAAGAVGVTAFRPWSATSMPLSTTTNFVKQNGYGDITAQTRRPRRRPT